MTIVYDIVSGEKLNVVNGNKEINSQDLLNELKKGNTKVD